MTIALGIACVLLAFTATYLALSLRSSERERRKDAARAESRLDQLRENQLAERDRILDALADALLLIDFQGIVQFANLPARELFQHRPLLRRPIDEIFLDTRLSSPVREAIAQQASVTRQITLPRQASPLGSAEQRGETCWTIDAGPVDLDNDSAGVRVIIRDCTAQQQAEQVRQDFVANASHELRTPLAIINGYIENLLDDEIRNDSEMATRFLVTMQKHGSRISRIVEDMLVISRLESGEDAALRMEPFDLPECADDVIDRLEAVVSSGSATIRTEFPKKGLQIIGDRFYWTQVLFNLIENSLKQNPGTRVTVEVGCKRTKTGELSIWVADNGIGIPSTDLPHVFRRFYRVEKHHSRGNIKGTGLGLSIVKRAVEAHGGIIEVSSTPGRSTRFEITLPAGAIAKKKRK
jgi:two-component system phosphate regulon sensor histidine kinase PhoR